MLFLLFSSLGTEDSITQTTTAAVDASGSQTGGDIDMASGVAAIPAHSPSSDPGEKKGEKA